MKIEINVEGATPEQLKKYTEILTVLIAKGALEGIRGGCVKIHFDANAEFQGIQFDYWPYRKRRA